MKIIKLTLIIGFLSIISAKESKAQEYGTLSYWGKNIKIDRSFFVILNSNYSLFLKTTAPNRRFFDFNDYNDIYVKMVDQIPVLNVTLEIT